MYNNFDSKCVEVDAICANFILTLFVKIFYLIELLSKSVLIWSVLDYEMSCIWNVLTWSVLDM